MKPTFIKHKGQSYKSLKWVSQTEKELFETHKMAHTYLFILSKGQYKMYVSHTSSSNTRLTYKK